MYKPTHMDTSTIMLPYGVKVEEAKANRDALISQVRATCESVCKAIDEDVDTWQSFVGFVHEMYKCVVDGIGGVKQITVAEHLVSDYVMSCFMAQVSDPEAMDNDMDKIIDQFLMQFRSAVDAYAHTHMMVEYIEYDAEAVMQGRTNQHLV